MTDKEAAARNLRERQRADWGAVAGGWQRYREQMSGPTSVITEKMLALARPRPGDRVLDLACGVGDPAFALAEKVGPAGRVLGLDFSPEMVEAARAWAEQHGVPNVEFRAIRSELELGVEPDSFDIVTCRLGLMFMPDPVAALRSLRAALKKGGRVVVSTWGPPERTPNFRLPMEIVGRHADLPPQEPGAPGLFAFPTPESLASALEAAGFIGVEATAFETPTVKAKDAESYWHGVGAMMAPLIPVLDSLTEEQRRAVHDDAVATVGALFPEGPVEMRGEAVAAAGAKG